VGKEQPGNGRQGTGFTLEQLEQSVPVSGSSRPFDLG
jgi:hypothetical protein